MSHPAWGEWIEILPRQRPAHRRNGLTPHGVSGLKFGIARAMAEQWGSHPAWGEWIEISRVMGSPFKVPMSHPAWGEWIEIRFATVHLAL